jgi:hypothetical protein
MMRLAVCPNCRVLHEVVSAALFDGADEDRRYTLTHCKLCHTPSFRFRKLEPEVPEVGPDELGYPAVFIEPILP